jgi:hypothetical protein
VSSIVAGPSIGAQIAARIDELAGATINNWMAERAIGSYPLQAVAASRAPEPHAVTDGGFLVLTIVLATDGMPWLGAAPVFVTARS